MYLLGWYMHWFLFVPLTCKRSLEFLSSCTPKMLNNPFCGVMHFIHTDNKVRGLCWMSGSHFEDDMTHDTPPEYKIVLQADWAQVIASHCFWVVLWTIASGISLSYCVIAAVLFSSQISCHFSRLSYFSFKIGLSCCQWLVFFLSLRK